MVSRTLSPLPHVAVVGSVYNTKNAMVLIEKQVVVRCDFFAEAMMLMFCRYCDLNIEYPQLKKQENYYCEIVQKVLFELGADRKTPKITAFLNNVVSSSLM